MVSNPNGHLDWLKVFLGIQISHDPQLNSPHSSTGSNNQTFLSSPSSMTSSMINRFGLGYMTIII